MAFNNSNLTTSSLRKYFCYYTAEWPVSRSSSTCSLSFIMSTIYHGSGDCLRHGLCQWQSGVARALTYISSSIDVSSLSRESLCAIKVGHLGRAYYGSSIARTNVFRPTISAIDRTDPFNISLAAKKTFSFKFVFHDLLRLNTTISPNPIVERDYLVLQSSRKRRCNPSGTCGL